MRHVIQKGVDDGDVFVIQFLLADTRMEMVP